MMKTKCQVSFFQNSNLHVHFPGVKKFPQTRKRLHAQKMFSQWIFFVTKRVFETATFFHAGRNFDNFSQWKTFFIYNNICQVIYKLFLIVIIRCLIIFCHL